MSNKKPLSFAPSEGDIIHANLDPVHGDIQAERRPYLVVSIRQFNEHFGLCMVSPITNGVGANGDAIGESPFFIDVESKRGRGKRVTGKVIANQFATIDWRHPGYECSYTSTAKSEVLEEVKKALKVYAGL